LSDHAYRDRLAERSVAAYKNHFSWEAIAKRYVTVLKAPVPAGKV